MFEVFLSYVSLLFVVLVSVVCNPFCLSILGVRVCICMFMCLLGSVQFPEVFAVSHFVVLLGGRWGCTFYSMLCYLEGLVLLGALQFGMLLVIAFAFRFRSIPLLAGVALMQVWVGPQVGAYFAHAVF